MSRGPRFVPLACPVCNGDLAGSARDVVCFCKECGRAFLFTAGIATPITARRVADLPPGDAGEATALPFWRKGPVAVPAFLTARPMTLARAASRLLGAWTIVAGAEPPYPIGGRLGPETLAPLAKMAGLPAPQGTLELLAVPARRAGARWRLPRLDLELVDDDVVV